MDFWKIPTSPVGWAVTHWWCRPTMLHSSICNPTRARRHVGSANLWKQGSCDPWADASRPDRPSSKKMAAKCLVAIVLDSATPGLRRMRTVQPVIVNGHSVGHPRLPSTTSWPQVQYKCCHQWDLPWLTCAPLTQDYLYTLVIDFVGSLPK